MRRQLLAVAGLLAGALVDAAVEGLAASTSEISTAGPSPTGTPVQACAAVSSSWSVQKAANPTGMPILSHPLKRK